MTCLSNSILGFRILFDFRRTQNSNSGGHKISIFIDKVPFTLFEHSFTKDELWNEIRNELLIKVFVKQPWLHRDC